MVDEHYFIPTQTPGKCGFQGCGLSVLDHPEIPRHNLGDEAKDLGAAVVERKTDWRVLRSLDAEVAERVMGWTRHPEQMHRTDNRTINGVLYCPPGFPAISRGGFNCVPYYSNDIAAAMKVVEMFIAKGGRVSLRGGVPELMGEDVPAGHWQVNFFRFARSVAPGTRFSFTIAAPTLPEAICRAALAALEPNETNSTGSTSQSQ